MDQPVTAKSNNSPWFLRKQNNKKESTKYPMFGIYQKDPKLIGQQLSRPHAPHKLSHFSLNPSQDNTIEFNQHPISSVDDNSQFKLE